MCSALDPVDPGTAGHGGDAGAGTMSEPWTGRRGERRRVRTPLSSLLGGRVGSCQSYRQQREPSASWDTSVSVCVSFACWERKGHVLEADDFYAVSISFPRVDEDVPFVHVSPGSYCETPGGEALGSD